MTNNSTHSNSEIKIKALGLCSGGLDSILAGVLLKRLGLDVTWISFETPFFSAQKAKKASHMTGIPLIVKDITPDYIKMLKNPACGYGKNMNPCMDCHALMFNMAGKIMHTQGFSFLFSGEVAGQRPMSQTKPSLRYVEKHSGFDGLILRPLSAQLLPPSIAEKNNWVDREKLLDISGRSRKRQMELARQWGIDDYPSPAGGCLLTESQFSVKLKDLFEHQTEYTDNDFRLLKYGRHFRLDDSVKVIVGRTQSDNENILKYYDPQRHVLIKLEKVPGPVVVIPGPASKEAMLLAASICASYSKLGKIKPVNAVIASEKEKEVVTVTGISAFELKQYSIID